MESFSYNTQHLHHLLEWIVERQRIFWRRLRDERPWTTNQVFLRYKFTNVYRVLDRASQFLLRNVIYNGTHYEDRDLFWRILLFKHFNSPHTWRYLKQELGDVTYAIPFETLIGVLDRMKRRGTAIYSNAYMLTASFMKSREILERHNISNVRSKHEAYLRIFRDQIMDNGLWEKIVHAETMEQAFHHLHDVITMGDFLTYQYVQDLNYTDLVNWDDNEFCAVGPGTLRGITRICIIKGKPNYADIVKETQRTLPRLLQSHALQFKPLPSHWPTVADISNCFCEVDKYMRALGIDSGVHGKRVKSTYRPSPTPINYMFPPKWGLNSLQ